MDATRPLNVNAPLFWQFYAPTTGLLYAPIPAPTATVYRLNEDGTRTQLVAPGAALTAISGLTGAYTYILDDSLNTALGQLIGQATTTDTNLTPYPEYATRNYVVEVLDIADQVWNDVLDSPDTAADLLIAAAAGGSSITPADIWNYLVADAGTDVTKMGGYIVSLLASIQAKTSMITNGVVPAVVSPYNASTQLLTLYYRDTYGGTESGRPIIIPVADTYDLTDPNIDTVNLAFKPDPGHPGQDPTLEVASTSLSAHQATFALTSEQMALFNPNARWRWDMQITYNNGDKATPVGGKVSVSGDVAP